MKRSTLMLLMGALAALPGLALAQAYPTKLIRIINPFPAGGTTEILGRIVGQGLQATLGQSVIIDTRAGAGGNIGLELTARSAPDGYTIAMYPISSVMAPSIYKNLSYDPLKDLVPIALVGKMPSLLVVHPSKPFKSVAEVVRYARENPGKLNYSSAGIGTSPHLFMELFLHLTGVSMNHVPYKGAGPALVDQVGGQVDIGFQTATAVLGYIQQGQLRALATSTVERFDPLPNLPSVAKSGVPDFDASAWFGMVAPARTPKPVIDRLNAETMKVLKAPAAAKRLDELGVMVSMNTPEEFGRFMQEEAVKWAKVAKLANIKAE
jgi:tripartite-type tricarboxylate transporter receptor subunit TctC